MGAVAVDLQGIDRCDVPDVLHGIAAHYGLRVDVLEKAEAGEGGEWPDPRSPKLTRLVELARQSWDEWGDRLVDELVDLANAGKLVPLTRVNEAALVELFRDHEAALVVRLTGRAPGVQLERLIKRGLVAPDIDQSALLPVAFRLGRALDVMQALPVKPESRATLAELVRESLATPLSREDEGALDHVQQRGYSLMRRPAVVVTGDVFREIANEDRRLSTDELTSLREAGNRAVRERASKTRWRELLHEAVKGHASLQNDLNRIARTESVNAHAAGAYRSLKARVGDEDPDVFKYTRPTACRQCRRIWGPPDAPKVYKLSVIEAREAAGGNFGLKPDEWGPVIGTVHPNCAESPLQRASKAMALVEARARAITGKPP